MKINANLLLLMVLLLVSAILNPTAKEHGSSILDGQKKLNMIADLEFIETCEFHNYGFFSFSTYLGQPISIGLLGNVHVLYDCLQNAIQDFNVRYYLRPNLGRGAPGIMGGVY